jgi:hypothetical protein
MEEEKARQEKLKAGEGTSASKDAAAAAPGPSNLEDDMLAQAIAMSMGDIPKTEDTAMDEDLSEEEQMRRAIELSMGASKVYF